MKLAIIGYGKMGKEIEKIALERNHEVILKIDSKNTHLLTDGSLAEADAAIEFSKPEKAVENILACFEAEVPVAVGTTGWYKEWEEVQDDTNAAKPHQFNRRSDKSNEIRRLLAYANR